MAISREEIQAEIGLDNTPFANGLRNVEKQLQGFGAKVSASFDNIGRSIVGLLAGKQLLDVGKAVLKFGSDLQASSERLGASVEFIQGFNFAAGQTNVSAQSASQALDTLSRKIGDAAAGSKEAHQAFALLGINIRDSAGQLKPTETIYREIADAIKAIPSPAARSAAAFAIFGRAGAQLLPLLTQGAKGFDALSDSIKKLSAEDIAKLDKLGSQLERIKTQLLIHAGSGFVAFTDRIEQTAFFLGALDVELGNASKGLINYKQAFDAASAATAKQFPTLAGIKTPATQPWTKGSGSVDPVMLKEFTTQLAALDAQAESKAEAIRQLFSTKFQSPRPDLVKEQVTSLKSLDEQIAELIRKASQEGLVIQPKNGR